MSISTSARFGMFSSPGRPRIMAGLSIRTLSRGHGRRFDHPGADRVRTRAPQRPRRRLQGRRRGADTAVWLACEAPHGLTGKCFRDRQEIPRWACPAAGPESSEGPLGDVMDLKLAGKVALVTG